MSEIFVLLPEMLQNVFADNCVAVVFLVAVIANLVLPKTFSSMAPRLKAQLSIIRKPKRKTTDVRNSMLHNRKRLRPPQRSRAEMHEGEGKRFPSWIHLIENRGLCP